MQHYPQPADLLQSLQWPCDLRQLHPILNQAALAKQKREELKTFLRSPLRCFQSTKKSGHYTNSR